MLGFAPGRVVERGPCELLFGERKAPDGTPLWRPPVGGRRAAEVYAGLLAAAPQAAAERKRELRARASREARRSPLFFGRSLWKSVSIFRASLGDNARLAREAGDADGEGLLVGPGGRGRRDDHAGDRRPLGWMYVTLPRILLPAAGVRLAGEGTVPGRSNLFPLTSSNGAHGEIVPAIRGGATVVHSVLDDADAGGRSTLVIRRTETRKTYGAKEIRTTDLLPVTGRPS